MTIFLRNILWFLTLFCITDVFSCVIVLFQAFPEYLITYQIVKPDDDAATSVTREV